MEHLSVVAHVKLNAFESFGLKNIMAEVDKNSFISSTWMPTEKLIFFCSTEVKKNCNFNEEKRVTKTPLKT